MEFSSCSVVEVVAHFPRVPLVIIFSIEKKTKKQGYIKVSNCDFQERLSTWNTDTTQSFYFYFIPNCKAYYPFAYRLKQNSCSMEIKIIKMNTSGTFLRKE